MLLGCCNFQISYANGGYQLMKLRLFVVQMNMK